MKSPLHFLRSAGLVFLCLFLSASAYAQKPLSSQDLLQRQEIENILISPERGTPHVIELNAALAAVAGKPEELIGNYFGLNRSNDEIRRIRTTANKQGMDFTLFQRIHNGIPVEHARYNIMSTATGPHAIVAEHYAMRDDINVQPTLTREQALAAAMEYVNAEQYAWEQIEADYLRRVWSLEITERIEAEIAAVQPGGELTIVNDYNTETYDLDLAWKFNLYATRPLSRAWIYVNAHTGEVMLYDRIIKHASEPTTVTTRYAGDRTIMVDLETSGLDPHNGNALLDSRSNAPATGGLYVLRDDTRGGGLETYDMNGVGGVPLSLPQLYAQGKAFTDDDLNWSLAEHKRGGVNNEAENDDTAWDAHWGTQIVYDYWLDVHGRRSYDDNDISIKSFLHYGVAYDNAFWNGTAMTYGDGSYQGGLQEGFAPLMSLDVCGHEIGHAICTFTSDLVYAKESGAMNEGFSDIWGAAIEAYAFRAVDADLENIMAPFGIGEQIDERDNGIQYPDAGWTALRYMNEPKLAGDPDTYGGANWVNPDCDPSLANDQCGVHTNSGVLNKWYFLLTAGEADVNDKGDSYSVNGVGFEMSERIAYGTELLLTPNATFAEARAASIAFVRTLTEAGGGNCGNLEQQVTNAWFGVGVGPAFSCGVTAGFTNDETFVGELVATSSECDASKTIFVEAAVVGNGSVTVGGTATPGKDFQVLNPNYQVGPLGFGVHNFEIEIFDDASIEPTETIILSLGGGLNHVIMLLDNEKVIEVGDANRTLVAESMRNASLPLNWEVVTLDGGPNSWFGNNTNGAQIGIIASGGATPSYEGNTSDPVDVVLSSPLIDARGTRNLNLAFAYRAGGERDAPTDAETPDAEGILYDYGTLAYSYDRETWIDFPEFSAFAGLNTGAIDAGDFNEILPDYLQGTQFYLGWRWRNDPLVNTAYSFSFEDVSLTGNNPAIGTTVASIEDDFGPNETIYFLSDDGTRILGTISNTSNHDFGCTTVEIIGSGTGATAFSDAGDYLDKTFRVTPAVNNTSAGYEVTWYFTDQEIEGYETASGTNRANISVFKTDGAIADASFADVTMAEYTVVTDLDGGVAFTSGFTSGFSSFAVGQPAAVLPVTLSRFTATTDGKKVNLDWKTLREENNDGFLIERAEITDGRFTPIGWVAASRSSASGDEYRLIDEEVTQGSTYLYRLTQRDLDGTEHNHGIREVTIGSAPDGWRVFPNPATDFLTVDLSGQPDGERLRVDLMTMDGRLLVTNTSGIQRSFDMTDLPRGVYCLRVHSTTGTPAVRRVLRQ